MVDHQLNFEFREEAEHQKRLEKIRAESREKRERIRRMNDESEREENRRLRMEREGIAFFFDLLRKLVPNFQYKMIEFKK